ncbi:ATP-binding protein [Roseibium sp. MMSF_3412]|uniref:AAA family ATPase n=1 Tax=Roseibium sp. MMSF_3412 TaxID=3046712 RepID=UPI00273FF6F4|nr:ATP-binding protein [Roseibium sp. MMSF_3412]
MGEQATLHLICGKIAAGKSTLARSLANAPGTILIREDAWLSELYGDQMQTLADYVTFSAKLRSALEPHIVDLLRSGLSVVLDFPANTAELRRWMRRLFETAGCAHELHLMDVSDEICKERLRKRNASGEHEFQVSDEQFDRVSQHFQPPTKAEGFQVRIHQA